MIRGPIECPACGGEGDVVTRGQIEYDRCRACGGVWLDCGELEVLLALAHRAGKRRGEAVDYRSAAMSRISSMRSA